MNSLSQKKVIPLQLLQIDMSSQNKSLCFSLPKAQEISARSV